MRAKVEMNKQDNCKQNLKKKAMLFFSLSIPLSLLIIGSMLYASRGQSDKGLWVALFAAVLLLVTLVLGLLFFQRSIVVPLQELCSTVQRISNGEFDNPVQIRTMDEIGQVGESVNDLVINVQEILLYAWNHTHKNFTPLKELPADPSLLKNEIAKIYRENENMKEFLLTFTYFEVKLEHEKMVSDTLDDSNADNS